MHLSVPTAPQTIIESALRSVKLGEVLETYSCTTDGHNATLSADASTFQPLSWVLEAVRILFFIAAREILHVRSR